MATFSGVGVSSSLFVAPGHGPTVVITGTFVATVLLERAVGDAWVTVATITSATNVGLPNLPGVYRLNCIAYTSGTVTYVLSSTPVYQVEIRAPDGSLSLGVDANGAGTLNDVTINQAIAGALAGTLLNLAAENGLTAHAGGTQAAALALSAVCSVHRVATVTTAADSVKLPPATAGAIHLVVNGAASNAMQVFGSGTDTINGVATATGVSQSAGITALYVCPAAGTWCATAIATVASLDGFTGATNTALGVGALAGLAGGGHNTAIGAGAAAALTAGQRNIAIGDSAFGNSGNPNNDCIAIGYYALQHATQNSNVAVGSSAGPEVTDGSNNVFIGQNSGLGRGNTSNTFCIGPIGFTVDEMGNLLNISVRYADGSFKTITGLALT